MLADLRVTEFLDALTSPAPTPGGGSAAALAGAMGAALLAMVAGMPKTKSGSPDERAALDGVKPRLMTLRATLTDLIDRDAAAYDTVVAAFKLPKASDEDKAARRIAIQAATRLATDVPLETMRACVEVMRLAETVAANGNPNAASDAKVGAALARTGLVAAKENVEINLSGLADAAAVAAIRGEVERLDGPAGV
jgi:formiminotetrahydrofolate cyclodeaminase